MEKLDYFGLHNASELFTEVQKAIEEYSKKPNERLFFFLVFSLNHLREWIAGCSYREMETKKKNNEVLSNNETFFFEIWKMQEFRVINSLCNRGKHYLKNSNGQLKTTKSQGLTCTSCVDDSLGQEYFRIDGVDSREVLYPVIRKYYRWFSENG